MNLQAEFRQALEHPAPFLVEKLLSDRIVPSMEEAEALFQEVKRFLVLTQADRSHHWEMSSLRIDEVWHQFILFTREYSAFCHTFFERYIPHSPSNAPIHDKETRPVATFEAFGERYEALYGICLPDLWHDELHVTVDSRVIHATVGTLGVRRVNGDVTLFMEQEPLLDMNDLALNAATMIATTGAFYVREMPDLTDEEKIVLASTLVQYRILRLAS